MQTRGYACRTIEILLQHRHLAKPNLLDVGKGSSNHTPNVNFVNEFDLRVCQINNYLILKFLYDFVKLLIDTKMIYTQVKLL